MQEIIKQTKDRGYTVTIYRDDAPIHPRRGLVNNVSRLLIDRDDETRTWELDETLDNLCFDCKAKVLRAKHDARYVYGVLVSQLDGFRFFRINMLDEGCTCEYGKDSIAVAFITNAEAEKCSQHILHYQAAFNEESWANVTVDSELLMFEQYLSGEAYRFEVTDEAGEVIDRGGNVFDINRIFRDARESVGLDLLEREKGTDESERPAYDSSN